MEALNKKTVCVTGGTGYIASWLIMRLLQQGYFVHTTTRSSKGAKKDISYLTNLPGASERLTIFSADLNEPDSFAAPIEGCIGVFHIAHPMDFKNTESEEVKTTRAINGTLGILKVCLDSKTVKRVVYTSSAYAVAFNDKGLDEMDENTWTDIDFVRALKHDGISYIVTKTLTERAALEFAEKNGLDLVTLIPTLVTGPFIVPHLPATVYTSMAMIFGNQDHYKYINSARMVHVDDLASAYIFLFDHPKAKGRHICCSINMTIDELFEFISTKYPEYKPPPTDFLKEIQAFKISRLSSKKLLDMGFKFEHNIDDVYDGAIQCCKKKGFL